MFNLGEDATLSCDVSFDARLAEETQVDWWRKGGGGGGGSNQVKGRRINWRDLQDDDDDDGDDRYSVTERGRNSSLIIKNVTLSDAGMWECQVSTPFEKINTNILLQVGNGWNEDLYARSVNSSVTHSAACNY